MEKIAEYLDTEYLPALKRFFEEQNITAQVAFWLRSRVKVVQTRIHFGGLKSDLEIGQVYFNVSIPEFLQDEYVQEVPDPQPLLTGDAIFYNLAIYPTHTVKPFKICYHCKAHPLPPGEGYFFSRGDFFQLCQKCGLMPRDKRENPQHCPPHQQYLYFVFSGEGVIDSFHDALQVLPEEEYLASSRQKAHTAQCGLCEKQSYEGIRFKCAVCVDLDLCETCFLPMVSRTHPKFQDNIQQLLQKKSCSGTLSHVFLAIYFNNTL